MKKILLYTLLISSLWANAQFWNQKASGFTTPNRSLFSISIIDANTVWALAADSSVDPRDLTIKEFTKSTDGGNTWAPGTIDLGANSSDLEVSSISAISATTAWISVDPGVTTKGGIWKTIDGGLTWTKQLSALFDSNDSYANFVYFWDANNGIAQGDPESGEFEIYTTADGGTNWIRVNGANIPDPNADTIGEYGIQNIFSVSGNMVWFGTDRGRIFRSSDKGLSWSAFASPSTDFSLDKFTFSDTNKGLLLQYDNTTPSLYSTTDGGANWSNAIPGMPASTDIAYIPGTSTVFSNNSDGALLIKSFYSIDNGITWTNIDSNIKRGLMVFLNTSLGFSSSLNTSSTIGGIYKFTGIPLKNSSFGVSNQISTYPNPTNGILHIDNENAFINQISVFDLAGRKVIDSKFSSVNKTDLDLKSLQTGEYLLKITSDSGNIATKKILKN